jgi:hypothetical protein
MADRGVSGYRLHHVNRALGRPAEKGSLDAPVLVAERDLQVEDLLAVALKPEMARLDNAGVNRANCYLMDFVPFDPVEVGDTDDGSLSRVSAPGIVARPVGSMKSDRLEPRMTFRIDAVLLGDLPLKEVRLRTVGRQGEKAVAFQGGFADV